ncbi:TRAP transporter small permease [Cereibacter azotoformans]|uniref:TRAP transporter small permease protein n=2 Tax=Cereibacter TaxID=1653176 RepID=A0A2T5K5L7_9RHOB|nr:TRAP transporter small permease [Cereibacter azotoformans]AXQ95536.1 TRAP transporter small permease [Cereibacter sphaeroides]PTR17721.1 TRAP-type C4-dicarboxylate transport system permease small subunit [Cereibacter azotoformans]UIJ32218.1 TRAP transporter small permease [Cereibacter azotoformans]ULB11890.1 TRAP transporter small permease [Cereibacter azotoformans]
MSGTLAAAPARSGGNAFIRTVHAISTVCGWTAAAFTVIALFVTCHMIFVRAVLNQSTIWQTEAVIYLMIAATTVGLPYVQRLRGHVNVDLVPHMLPRRVRRVLAYVVLISTIAVMAVLAWYAFDVWHQAFDRNWKSSTVWAAPLWVPYLAMPVGFGLFILQLVADLVGLITGAEPPFGIEDH